MKRLFAPLTRLLARLQYAQKFVLISLLLILPLTSFYPLLMQVFTRIDQYGTRELYGAEYLTPLQHLLQDVVRHEQTYRDLLTGRTTTNDVADRQNAVDTDLKQLRDVDGRYGAILGVQTRLDSLEQQWQQIKINLRDMPTDERLAAHSKLLDDIYGLMGEVGDSSFLILDPDSTRIT
jgi:methyl-accepting chemotaxis protein